MDIAVTMIFHIIAFLLLLFALYEEREIKNSDEEEEKSDNLSILLLLFSMLCFWIAGITMFYVTQTYYSVTTDTLVETFMEDYRPLGWFGVIMGMLVLYFLVVKVIDLLKTENME